MYFNRKGAKQTNWRMVKKGKHFLFGCSLVLALGANSMVSASEVEVGPEPDTDSSEEVTKEYGSDVTSDVDPKTYQAPVTDLNVSASAASAEEVNSQDEEKQVEITEEKKEEVQPPSSTTQNEVKDSTLSSSSTDLKRSEISTPSETVVPFSPAAEPVVEATTSVTEVVDTPSKNTLDVSVSAASTNTGDTNQPVANRETLESTAQTLSNIDKVTNSLEAAYVANRFRSFVPRAADATALAVNAGTDQNTPHLT